MSQSGSQACADHNLRYSLVRMRHARMCAALCGWYTKTGRSRPCPYRSRREMSQFDHVNGSHYTRVRAYIIRYFIRTYKTHFVFIKRDGGSADARLTRQTASRDLKKKTTRRRRRRRPDEIFLPRPFFPLLPPFVLRNTFTLARSPLLLLFFSVFSTTTGHANCLPSRCVELTGHVGLYHYIHVLL